MRKLLTLIALTFSTFTWAQTEGGSEGGNKLKSTPDGRYPASVESEKEIEDLYNDIVFDLKEIDKVKNKKKPQIERFPKNIEK